MEPKNKSNDRCGDLFSCRGDRLAIPATPGQQVQQLLMQLVVGVVNQLMSFQATEVTDGVKDPSETFSA